ncbi:MAG: BamA/TamA family outer membrane protein [Cyclobacteriaceae bacterium]
MKLHYSHTMYAHIKKLIIAGTMGLLAILGVMQEAYSQKFLGFRPLNDTIPDEKGGFVFLPLVYYTPDTRWAFGGAGVYYFKIPPKYENEQVTRVSNVNFLADYTQNRQLDVWGTWNIFTRNENYLIKGELRFRNFPDRFYGIGNNSSKEAEELYAYDLFSLKYLMLRKIKPSLFAGLDIHFENEYNFTLEDGGLLEQGNITGYNGGRGVGVGFVTVFDSRDNVINAHSGQLAEFSSYFFRPAFGSQFNFTSLNATYQKYWQIKRNHIIASQTVMQFNIGAVPFLDMSTLGSDVILRGYPKNRFRDNNFWASQVEYRFPIYWRFGGVGFAGLGDVYSSASDLQLERLKYSVGAGLRFVVNPAERLNVRLDYGFGREGGYYYFVVTEAF